MTSITFPTGFFCDPLTGQPLGTGKVYIGQPDLDPREIGNRLNVVIIQEDGSEVTLYPASQPFVLSGGGMFQHNGSVVVFTVDEDYSMAVDSAQDVQAYYFPQLEAE